MYTLETKRAAFRFFLKHAGYQVGRAAIGAWELAKAEMDAYDEEKGLGLSVRWEGDDFAEWAEWEHHEEWCAQARRAKAEGERPNCEHNVLYCVVTQGTGQGAETLASLGGIIDPDANYQRVVETELFQEAIRVLHDRDTESFVEAMEETATLAAIGG